MRQTQGYVSWAVSRARGLLEPLGDRWLHVHAVGGRAERTSVILPKPERVLLIDAAYLHDVGYAPALLDTGLHQLDGARWLRSLGEERLARLVAHHSESRFEVDLNGLSEVLAQYPREESAVADALTYCDITTGPTGEPMEPARRLAEVGRRYEPGGTVMTALERATPYLLAAVARTEERLHHAGLTVGR